MRTRRNWVKFHVTGWLHGTIRYQLDPAERGVWADLICLAGECGKEGYLVDNNGNPYPDDYIAHSFNISLDLFNSTIKKRMEDKSIERNGTGALHIVNWALYQPEYDRQKPYRERAKRKQRLSDVTAQDLGLSWDELSKLNLEEKRALAKEKGLI